VRWRNRFHFFVPMESTLLLDDLQCDCSTVVPAVAVAAVAAESSCTVGVGTPSPPHPLHDATSPTPGWTWFAVPDSTIATNSTRCVYYQNGALHTTIYASNSSIEDKNAAADPSISLPSTTATVVQVTASTDGRYVAVATLNGAVTVYTTGSNNATMESATTTAWSLENSWTVLGATPNSRHVKLEFGTGATTLHTLAVVKSATATTGGQLYLIPCSHDFRQEVTMSRTSSLLSDVAAVSWSPPSSSSSSSTSNDCYLAVARLGGGSAMEIYRVVMHTVAGTINPTLSLSPPSDESLSWSCCHLHWFVDHTLAIGYSTVTAYAADEEDATQNESYMCLVPLTWPHKNDAEDSTWQCGGPVSSFPDLVPSFDPTRCFWTCAVLMQVETAESSSPPQLALLVTSNVANDIISRSRP
jgi:hypothetical protein